MGVYALHLCVDAAPKTDSRTNKMKAFLSPAALKCDVRQGRSHHRLYLDDLFDQIIAQRLGARISESIVDQLQRARNACLDEKAALDRWAMTNGYQADELIFAYQILFDGLNEQYKTILPPDDYERLFNMGYDTPLDIMRFLPL